VSQHPYQAAPDRAFWLRSVANSFDPATLIDKPPFELDRTDRFMSAGSCFAANVRGYVERAGFDYVVTERTHPALAPGKPDMYYDAFSARYGNIYTARQMTQLLERSIGLFAPQEDHWVVGEHWIDPYRPGLRHPASSERELRLLTKQHLDAVRAAVEQATVLVFTLGLTEAWLSAVDGAVFPACPGTVNGEFNPARHVFHNFDVEEVTDDLVRMVDLASDINPRLKIVLTVSPVPLVATATGRHVLAATTYSKSVLRVAADVVASRLANVAYFPAYELVAGPQAQYDAYLDDRRNVSETAVARVMGAFFTSFFGQDLVSPGQEETESDERRFRELEAAVAEAMAAECEEEMAGR
jgi:GSCFA family